MLCVEVSAMYEIDKQKFGAFVASLRKEKGYTQKELAQRLFLSNQAISKWETGASIPDTAMLLPLADALGVTVTELLLCRRQNSNEAIPPKTVEEIVKTAVLYRGGKTERAWQKTRHIAIWYLISLLSGAAGMYLIGRNGVQTASFWSLFLLCAGFGGYFFFFARISLPAIYDQCKVGILLDGVVRIHLPGLSFNNRNWPPILFALRIWACAAMALLPLLLLALTLLFPALPERAQLTVVLVPILGGLFLPVYFVGKRYGG